MEMKLAEKIIVNSFFWNFPIKHIFLPNIFEMAGKKGIRDDTGKAGVQPCGKILEVGCGRGKTTKLINAHFKNSQILAIDFDLTQVQKAKSRDNNKNIEFRQMDATNLDFKNNSFDAAFSFNALHHIKNYPLALREIFRVLKKCGCFYVMDLTKAFFYPFFHFFAPAEAYFSKEEFLGKIEKAGFRIEEIRGGSRIVYAKALKYSESLI